MEQVAARGQTLPAPWPAAGEGGEWRGAKRGRVLRLAAGPASQCLAAAVMPHTRQHSAMERGIPLTRVSPSLPLYLLERAAARSASPALASQPQGALGPRPHQLVPRPSPSPRPPRPERRPEPRPEPRPRKASWRTHGRSPGCRCVLGKQQRMGRGQSLGLPGPNQARRPSSWTPRR